MARPTISLCMIVRDEEERLPKCLESVKDLVDEIIVVDTGSKDKTMEIARSFGAKLYQHPWPNSFSAARNISLSYAASDWVLILDADEWLDQGCIPKIKKILREDKEHVGIIFAVYSETGDGMSKLYSIRLFKNHQGFHYEGIVHNQLIINGRILTTEFRVYHSGYNLPPDQAKKKLERSAKLLKDGLKKNPDNLYYRFHLAKLYRSHEMYPECIKEALTALNLTKTKTKTIKGKETLVMLMCDLAYSYYKLHDYREAEKVCLEAVSMCPYYPDIIMVLGFVYSKMGRTEKEIATFKKFIEVVKQREEKPRVDSLMVDTIGLVYNAYHYIGEAYLKLSRLDEAITNLKLSIEHNPQNAMAYESLIHCYHRTREVDKIRETCLKAIANEAADVFIYYQLGLIYKAEQNPAAKDFLKKVIELKPDRSPAYLELIDIYSEEQDFQAIYPLLDKLKELEPEGAGCLYKAAEDKEAGRDDYQEAIREARLWSHLRELLRTYSPDRKELDLEAVAAKIYQEAHKKGDLAEEGALGLLAYECLRRISREETNYA
ncbi:MAG: glycosyltransferase [bacterium]